MKTFQRPTIAKRATHIPGFDLIVKGGLPDGRSTLVSGVSGTGKTVFAIQFLTGGIVEAGDNGVFVTFEESPEDIRRNMVSLGWDIAGWESENKWAFVDASPQSDAEAVAVGPFDLGALLVRVEHAVREIGARRVVLDSLGSLFSRFPDRAAIRGELFRILRSLKDMNVTAVVTSERRDESASVDRFGAEAFVADAVVVLRNILEDEKRRRTIEIFKYRGASHLHGEYPFTIVPDKGIMVLSLAGMELKQQSGDIRITSGSTTLDGICGGGFFRDSIILVSGATGTGKTLMTTEFIQGGARNGERCLLFAFEESREQLFRNANGWGVDFERIESEGNLRLVCEYPEVSGMEDRLIMMKRVIEEFKPDRVAVDSLSALERISSIKGFREFVIGLTSFIKHQETAGLFTSTTPTLMGGESVTEAHISTLTDSIILLRYVELYGEMRRGLTVLKMRGSQHDKNIFEFTIDGEGLHIGKPFRNISGILAGMPATTATLEEVDRLDAMFRMEERREDRP